MMKHVRLIFLYVLIGQSLGSFGQDVPIKITGITLVEETKDTMPLVVIEVFSGGERIGITRSDFDGRYLFNLCPCAIVNDSIVIRLTGYQLEITEFSFLVNGDTRFNHPLRIDPEQKIGPNDLFYFGVPECGTDEIQLYQSNPLMQHCDGRLAYYDEIQGSKICWELAQKTGQ